MTTKQKYYSRNDVLINFREKKNQTACLELRKNETGFLCYCGLHFFFLCVYKFCTYISEKSNQNKKHQY